VKEKKIVERHGDMP